jgi:hypothetical protein
LPWRLRTTSDFHGKVWNYSRGGKKKAISNLGDRDKKENKDIK